MAHAAARFGEDFFAVEEGFLKAEFLDSEDFGGWDKSAFSVDLDGVFSPFFNVYWGEDFCYSD